MALYYLSMEWLPLGAHNSLLVNFLFVAGIVAVILGALMTMVHFYEPILRWALIHKWKFLILPAFTLFFGLLVWQGFDKLFGPVKDAIRQAVIGKIDLCLSAKRV